MKIAPRNISSFLKSVDKNVRAALFYGPDDVLIEERAKTLSSTVVNDINDPFSVAKFDGLELAEDTTLLADEAAAVPMMGGDRLVYITNAGDKNTPSFKDYLADPTPHCLVVVSAGELRPSSSLRKLFDGAKNAASLACYVEGGADLTSTIRDLLAQQNCTADSDAVQWLSGVIDGDRAKVRGELEKLALYHGACSNPISLEEAQEVCADSGAAELDALVYGLSSRNPKAALLAYSRLLGQGTSDVFMLRSVQNHFRRLHLAKSMLEAGQRMDAILKSLRIFFKQAPAFRGALQSWPLARLTLALERLADLEARCKQSGAPVKLLCSQAFLSIAR